MASLILDFPAYHDVLGLYIGQTRLSNAIANVPILEKVPIRGITASSGISTASASRKKNTNREVLLVKGTTWYLFRGIYVWNNTYYLITSTTQRITIIYDYKQMYIHIYAY